jgi:hypothetical protein
MSAAVDVTVRDERDGWIADVTVRAERETSHRVRVTRDEYARYGRGDVTDLVRRSFAFLLAREPNTSILREFSLGTIERYFPDYAREIRPR